ncbi:hypothetical protein BJX66DRAFT_328074 [Aspergillus keveii]|uniref:Uncharacterized protein n=1 Tax=Aspergillus keveii TaxID=714993 RepID=A0ABR4FVV8_9EURO
MSDPNNYTVGLICAITKEYVTARTVLEEERPGSDYVSLHGHDNYTLGRIRQHKSVIAVFPESEDGTDPAAVVTRDLLHTFTDIQIGLKLGVGGDKDLESPPTFLQTAVSGLKARHEAQGHSFSALVNEVLFQSTRLKKDFCRPDQSSGQLYRSDVLWLIASANRLMEDAQIRDIVALKNGILICGYPDSHKTKNGRGMLC